MSFGVNRKAGDFQPHLLGSSATNSNICDPASTPRISPTWLKSGGSLDIDRLIDAFREFWLQHGELLWAPYNEISPHIVLLAFLHRVVNAGGITDWKYAVGLGRVDLCVWYRLPEK